MSEKEKRLDNAEESEVLVESLPQEKDVAGICALKPKLSRKERRKNNRSKKAQDCHVEKLDATSTSVNFQPLKRKVPGFHEKMFSETSYFFRNGLRYVYPYPFTFVAHVKARWFGLKVLDVFKREFQMKSAEHYVKAISSGKIRVSDAVVDQNRVLSQRDILQTCVHRHEPPVVNQPIEFLENSPEMVVINKPSSVPVHPCGRYRHNTIVFILGKEHGLERLHTIHRLDRLTSGILMFAKTVEKAREMEQAVHSRLVEKEYLCRVVGEFPSDEVSIEEPVMTVSHKIGVCHVSNKGKPCSTRFSRLSYNGKTSLVKCIPQEGRMHQIRVHLQWLGFPIVNDPIYNHPTAWGYGKGKCGTNIPVKEVLAELVRTRKDKLTFDESDEGSCSDSILDFSQRLENDVADSQSVVALEPTLHQATHLLGNPNVASTELSVNSECSPCKRPKLEHDLGTASVQHDGVQGSADVYAVDVPSRTSREQVKSDFLVGVSDNAEFSEPSDKPNDSFGKRLFDSQKLDGVGLGQTTYTSRDFGENYVDPSCSECQHVWVEPSLSELVMYLHAYSYKGPGWAYRTSLPDWASDDFAE